VIGRCLVGLFVLILAASTETSAQKSSGLPRAIETAFRKAYPNATILHASRERRNGQVVYEVESRDGSTQRDLVYDLAGQALEIEETIPADSMPPAVRTALERDAPGAAIVRAERVTSAAGISYEILVRRSGLARSLTYDAAGRRRP